VPIEKLLRSMFNLSGNLRIFDIGACEGEDSVRYSNLFKNSAVYAFEPRRDNLEKIKTNIIKYRKVIFGLNLLL